MDGGATQSGHTVVMERGEGINIFAGSHHDPFGIENTVVVVATPLGEAQSFFIGDLLGDFFVKAVARTFDSCAGFAFVELVPFKGLVKVVFGNFPFIVSRHHVNLLLV